MYAGHHKSGLSPPLLSPSLTALLFLPQFLSGQDQHQDRLGEPQGGNDDGDEARGEEGLLPLLVGLVVVL
jgi:hypothetical protein